MYIIATPITLGAWGGGINEFKFKTSGSLQSIDMLITWGLRSFLSFLKEL
jgi:hypothetical protein